MINMRLPYLNIKGVLFELIDTLELMGVALNHGEAVFCSVKYLDLIQHFRLTSYKMPFPLNQHIGAPLPIHSKSGRLLLIGVCVNNQGEPDCFDVLCGKGVHV